MPSRTIGADAGQPSSRARAVDSGEPGSRACSSQRSRRGGHAGVRARRRHAGHRRRARGRQRRPALPGRRGRRPRSTLPDDWAESRPGFDGSVWYRARFRLDESAGPDDLLALYIERACSNVQVHLNGALIFSGGRMVEPVTRNCARPQLVTLPPALLRSGENVARPARRRPSARARRVAPGRGAGSRASSSGRQSTLLAGPRRRACSGASAGSR